MRGISPFIYEDFVPKEKFFDREEELEYFYRSVSVKRKMLLCIVAPLKYGKTSLMMRYLEILKDFSDIIPVYINLKKKEKPIKLLVETLRSVDIDIEGIYRVSKQEESLEILFDTINRALTKKAKWLFLLIDEFHLLPSRIRSEGFYKNFEDEDIFGFFRSFAEGARISYVVCGSIVDALMRALDVWGGRFQMVYLGPFSEDDAVSMLKKLFEEGGMHLDDSVAKEIAESAGYHPFYMQYMGHHIYMSGSISRASIRDAKKELYKFLSSIFHEYLKRIRGMGILYLEAIKKLLNGSHLDIDDRIALGDLVRIGILKPENSKYGFVDPVFKRYIALVLENMEPAEVNVVGHWAERIVGNYLVKNGFIPYYSHDSRGAFDIYVCIENIDVGIQVKYISKGEVYLSDKEYDKIQKAADENGWIPILALVQKTVKFFPIISHGKYEISKGYPNIKKAIKMYKEQH